MATLKKELSQMLADARAQLRRPITRALSNGLTIEITQQSDGIVQLTLVRTGTSPTVDDWLQVTERWPEQMPADVVPGARSEGRRWTLTGRWPRPAVITEAAA